MDSSKITLKLVQDAEEFLRKLIREEIDAYMLRTIRSRGWRRVEDWPPSERKSEVGND